MENSNQAPSGANELLCLKNDQEPISCGASSIKLINSGDQPRVDSFEIAENIGIQHKNVMGVIDSYQADFEELTTLAFKTRKSKGRPTRYALLNEDQAYLLLTYSKNTPQVRSLKLNLVRAFKQSREGTLIQKDYLPFYHSMHDSVKMVAQQASVNGSKTPEYVFHMMYNKLINGAFGLTSGERKTITHQERVFISSAQAIATKSIEMGLKTGVDHRLLYQQVKEQIQVYANTVRGLFFKGIVGAECDLR
jgi:phage regulator Rha-like protein